MVAILSRRSKPAAPSSARELHSLLLCKQDRARLKGYHCLGRTCSHSWRHCSTLAVLASLFAVGHVCWRHPFHGTGGRRGRDGLRSIRFGRRLLQRLQPVGRTVAGGHHLTRMHPHARTVAGGHHLTRMHPHARTVAGGHHLTRMHPHARTVAGGLVALLACLHRYTHSYAAALLHDCTTQPSPAQPKITQPSPAQPSPAQPSPAPSQLQLSPAQPSPSPSPTQPQPNPHLPSAAEQPIHMSIAELVCGCCHRRILWSGAAIGSSATCRRTWTSDTCR